MTFDRLSFVRSIRLVYTPSGSFPLRQDVSRTALGREEVMFQFDQCNNNFSLVLTLLLKPVQLSVKATETIFFLLILGILLMNSCYISFDICKSKKSYS